MERRTKIVATIGPASRSTETMEALITAGVDVFRLNFSHGSRADHTENVAMAREAARRSGKEIGLLGDLPGPKLRLGELEGGFTDLVEGSEVSLKVGGEADASCLPVTWEGLPSTVKEGNEVFLADGRIRLRVLSSGGDEARCEV